MDAGKKGFMAKHLILVIIVNDVKFTAQSHPLQASTDYRIVGGLQRIFRSFWT